MTTLNHHSIRQIQPTLGTPAYWSKSACANMVSEFNNSIRGLDGGLS